MFASYARQARKALPPVGRIIAGGIPHGGINARDALAAMPPTDAIELVNVLSNPYGMGIRNGYQEFAINLPGAAEVKTVMSFYPGTVNPPVTPGPVSGSMSLIQVQAPRAAVPTVNGQIFACTNGQVYDITAGGTGPWSALLAAAVTTDYWNYINFQNDISNFLCACNEDGGYYVYGGSGFSSGFSSGFAIDSTVFNKIQAGSTPGKISGINPDLFTYCVSWKRRLWFIEKNSTRAWYLPVQQITGAASMFDFGVNFRHGGSLAVLVSWTVDGGEGLDDYLVAISTQGDVVIYKGTDPNDATTFALHGIWYVGALPRGKRCVDPVGGDIYILSVAGLSQISKLIAMGQIAAELTEDIGDKLDPLIRAYMQTSVNKDGWFVKMIPHEQMLVVGVPPQVANAGAIHLALKIRQNAWSKMMELPITHYTNHDSLVFGGGNLQSTIIPAGGKVMLMFDNSLDYETLSDTVEGTLIKCRIVPAYQTFGTPAMIKRFTMVRPTFIAQYNPSGHIILITDYGQLAAWEMPVTPVQSGDVWDQALWDQAYWSGLNQPVHKWVGVHGAGFAATAQIDFIGAGGTLVTAIDYATIEGGPL